MGAEKELVVTIVNKNYPPGPGITGESANELAGWLQKKGVRVNVVHSDGRYSGGANVTQPNGRSFLVKSLYDGKNKLIRLVSSFIESFSLIRKAKKIGPEGLIIVMTDPPFLVLWAGILLKKNKWSYWTMDLYPEAFVAGGLVSKKNYLYRQFKKIVSRNPPDHIIALGKYQLAYILKGYEKEIASTILPCGVSRSSVAQGALPEWKANDKIVLGYCGNIGEAHSADFLIKLIDTFDEEKFRLLISVYGSKAHMIKEAVRSMPSIIVKDRVERSELSFIDVHLVTLQPHWNHICVPSKAVSAVCEGGTIAFCGDTENDNWSYLQDAGWLIKDDANLGANIREVLTGISPDSLTVKKNAAMIISEKMQALKEQAFGDIYAFLSGIKRDAG